MTIRVQEYGERSLAGRHASAAPACRCAPRFSGRNHARPLAHYAPLVLGSSAHPRCARISRSTEELATNRQCGAPQADGGGPVPPSPSAFVAPRARARPLFCLMINRIPYFRRPIDIPALGPLPQRCISMGRRIGIYIIIKILMAPLRAWRPPRCPLACCAALRGRVAPAFILRPCWTEAAPSPPLPPSSRLVVLAPLLLRRMGRDRPDSSACPLPLPAGALISFRSAKIPIPAPSPATLPPPAPGGGLKCILDNRAVFSPFPAPSPVLAPVRPRPFAPTSHGARPSRQLGLPPPAPGGGIKSHHSHKKHLSSVRLVPTTFARFFFPPRCRSSARLAPTSQSGQTNGSVECLWLALL